MCQGKERVTEVLAAVSSAAPQSPSQGGDDSQVLWVPSATPTLCRRDSVSFRLLHSLLHRLTLLVNK